MPNSPTALTIDQSRLAQAFWARVDRQEGCWLWTGHVHPESGYGSYSFGGRGYRAHRLSLQLHGTETPSGLDVCHRCDNRRCVNPDHLYVGTRKQNMADCTERGRHNKPRGEGHWCAKLSADEVRVIRLRRDAGDGVTTLAAVFKVHHSTISRICRREWRGEVT